MPAAVMTDLYETLAPTDALLKQMLMKHGRIFKEDKNWQLELQQTHLMT